MRSPILILTLLALVFMAFAALPASSASGGFNEDISAPSYVGAGQNFTITVNESKGYSNYTVVAYFGGENLSGFSQTSSYYNFLGNKTSVKITSTAPSAPGTIYVTIVSSADFQGFPVRTTQTVSIEVVQPLVFRVSVSNSDTVAVKNLTVNFYLNSIYIGNKTVAEVSPGSTTSVNFTYVSPSIKPGEYKLTVNVSNPFVSINGNGGSYTTTFYYGNPPNYNWIYYVAGVVVVVMIFIALAGGRRTSGTPPPKW